MNTKRQIDWTAIAFAAIGGCAILAASALGSIGLHAWATWLVIAGVMVWCAACVRGLR